jgi:hypothetical protein
MGSPKSDDKSQKSTPLEPPNTNDFQELIHIEDNSTQTTQEWEQHKEWEFLMINGQIDQEIQEFLKIFQEHAPHLEVRYTPISSARGGGIFGSLIDYFGHFYNLINNSPDIKNGKLHIFSLGSYQFGGIIVNYRFIHILLSGINFRVQDSTCHYLVNPQFHKGPNWLLDDHITILVNMIQNQKIILPNTTGKIIKDNILCMNSHLYQKWIYDKDVSMQWLRQQLYEHDLLTDTGLHLDLLMLPYNKDNSHWILTFFDLTKKKFYVLDPFKGSGGKEPDIREAQELAFKIEQDFALELPGLQKGQNLMKNYQLITELPIQHPRDSCNCGVYICLYMIILSLKTDVHQIFFNYIRHKTIDECRALLLAWIIKGEIFLLDDQVSSRRSL